MAEYRYTLRKFLRDWALIISMSVGAGAYLIYHAMPALHPAGPALYAFATHFQPVLLFLMLFFSFCKIEPHQMRPHRWMYWLLLVQSLSFVALALLLIFVPGIPFRLGFEAAMLCMITPTATACAVVTGKLGGNMAGVMTYTILINLVVAVLIPLMVPLLHPVEGLSFYSAFLQILGRVFPLLVMPCLCAWIVRYLFPRLLERLLRFPDIPFYLWVVSLSIAIMLSTRALVRSDEGAAVLVEIAAACLATCILQFWAGRRIGRHYACPISAGQSLGQKNTAFEIWVGYTFLSPVVSVAGGFYSICHNVFNSWQLYRRRIGRQ